MVTCLLREFVIARNKEKISIEDIFNGFGIKYKMRKVKKNIYLNITTSILHGSFYILDPNSEIDLIIIQSAVQKDWHVIC